MTIQAPGFWLLVSLLTALPIAFLASRLSPRGHRMAMLARWVLIPYLGLLAGALSPRLMGLNSVNWLASLSLGMGLLFVILLLLLLVRSTIDLPHSQAESDESAEASQASRPNRIDWPNLLLTTIYSGGEQFHWSFLRGAIWEMLLVLPMGPALPAYTATWIAALFAIVESMVWERSALGRLVKLVLVITTSILFFYTRNFWLCWILHAAVTLILSPSSSRADPPRSCASGLQIDVVRQLGCAPQSFARLYDLHGIQGSDYQPNADDDHKKRTGDDKQLA
ncbi:MAG: hypothetical protein HC802_20345 [Caldilineaceae bacterium]|nr:hypothetical protein [Caldilineaceae bacterium]